MQDLPLEATVNRRDVVKGFSAVGAVANGQQEVDVWNLLASLPEDVVFLIGIVESIAWNERSQESQ